jgi:hypothetical protein
MSVFDGATESIVYSGAMNAVGITYKAAIVGNSTWWTQGKINGYVARVGYSTDISPLPQWDALMLEVAARPIVSTPASVTIVGTGGGSTVNTSYADAGAAAPTLSTWTTTK